MTPSEYLREGTADEHEGLLDDAIAASRVIAAFFAQLVDGGVSR